MTHGLLPSLPPFQRPLPATQLGTHSTFPPPVPIQPTYIPPSPPVALGHQSANPRDHSFVPSHGSSWRLDWNLPVPDRSSTTLLSQSTPPQQSSISSHHLPPASHSSSMMAPKGLPLRGPHPPWLLPTQNDWQARRDPFIPSGYSAYGMTSSPAGYANSRAPAASHSTSPHDYSSSSTFGTASRAPPQDTEDTYAQARL